jgi:hypothetical protein
MILRHHDEVNIIIVRKDTLNEIIERSSEVDILCSIRSTPYRLKNDLLGENKDKEKSSSVSKTKEERKTIVIRNMR